MGMGVPVWWSPPPSAQGPPCPHRSVSLKGLSPFDIDSSTEQLDGLGQHQRDPRRTPLIHSKDDLESLLSQDEEDEADVQRAQVGALSSSSSSSSCPPPGVLPLSTHLQPGDGLRG